MVRLDGLSDPDGHLCALYARQICQNLSKVLMIRAAKLVLDDHPPFGLIDGSREDVGTEGANPMLDRLNLKHHAESVAKQLDGFRFGEPRCEVAVLRWPRFDQWDLLEIPERNDGAHFLRPLAAIIIGLFPCIKRRGGRFRRR
jgi:hypothetical protein